MTRIVPPANYNLKPDYPKWLNPNTVAEAGEKDREEVNKLTKKASAPDKVVVSYMCNNCSKIIQAGNSDLLKQATLASKANKEFIPTCPDCGNEVKPYQVIEKGTVISNIHSMNEAKRVDLQEGLQKEASSRGTYNTFIDQRIVYRAIEELNKYASKNGMTGCRARYLRSEHKKEAGSNTSTLNNIECNLEWLYGRNQKGNATATIGVDVAGNFIFPKVFKVASGMEYPFKEEYIRQLEKEPSLFQSFPSPRKSDVPTIRKSDPSRFRAYAGKEKVVKVGEYKKNASEYPEYDEFLRGQYYDSVPEEEAAGELLKLYPEYFDTYEDALDYVNLAFSQYSNYGEPGIRESSKKVGEYKLKKKSNVIGKEFEYHGRTGFVKSIDDNSGITVHFPDVDEEEFIFMDEVEEQDPMLYEDIQRYLGNSINNEDLENFE